MPSPTTEELAPFTGQLLSHLVRPCETIGGLLLKMEATSGLLAETHPHIAPFANTYFTLTKYLNGALTSFDNPTTMEHFACKFSEEWFGPVASYLDPDYGEIPRVWRPLLNNDPKSELRKLSPWWASSWGVIPHILNDLPQTLKSVDVSRHDYMFINNLVIASGPALAAAYLPDLNRITRWGLCAASTRHVIKMRKTAWNDHCNGTSTKSIERNTLIKEAQFLSLMNIVQAATNIN